MKVIKKQIVTEVEEFEAIDGKIFDNPKDCEEWDKSYWCTIVNSFDKLKKLKVNGANFGIDYCSEDYDTFLMRFNNMDEIAVFNAYVSKRCCYGEPVLNVTHIGKLMIINFGYDYDFCDVYDFEKQREIVMNYLAKTEADFLEKEVG